jgi:hypothetical protein
MPITRRQFWVTAVNSASVNVNVTLCAARPLSTRGGRKQATQKPSLCRTLGYTIPAEPLVKRLSPSSWEAYQGWGDARDEELDHNYPCSDCAQR